MVSPISQIPSEKPSYSYKDLAAALAGMANKDIEEKVREKVSKYFGGQHVFFFPQARIATYYYLKSMGLEGEEVICPDFTALTFPYAIKLAGCKVKFSDVKEKWLNTESEQLKKAASKKTRCFTATPQFGFPCNIEAIKEFCDEKKILLFEDNAAALGATYEGKLLGSFGHASVISFDTSKQLSSFIGGALITNDDKLAEKINKAMPKLKARSRLKIFSRGVVSKILLSDAVYKLAFPIWSKVSSEFTELNDKALAEMEKPKRYDESISRFQLSLINVQWGKLDENIEKRRAMAGIYYKALKNCENVELFKSIPNANFSPMKFPVLVGNKESVHKRCLEKGLDVSMSFSYSCSEKFYKKPLKNSYYLSRHLLSLPINSAAPLNEAKAIAERFLGAVESRQE